MTQTELVNNMVSLTGLKRKEAKNALGAFKSIGQNEMKKRGLFVLPGFAKFVIKNKAATKVELINQHSKNIFFFHHVVSNIFFVTIMHKMTG